MAESEVGVVAPHGGWRASLTQQKQSWVQEGRLRIPSSKFTFCNWQDTWHPRSPHRSAGVSEANCSVLHIRCLEEKDREDSLAQRIPDLKKPSLPGERDREMDDYNETWWRQTARLPWHAGEGTGEAPNQAEFTSRSYPAGTSGSSFKTFFWKLMWYNINYRRGDVQCFLVYEQKDYIYTIEKNDLKLGNKAERPVFSTSYGGIA